MIPLAGFSCFIPTLYHVWKAIHREQKIDKILKEKKYIVDMQYDRYALMLT